MLNYKNIIKLLIFPVLVYMFNSIFQSVALDFYDTYSVDTLMHFLGGLSIAYSANYALSLMGKKGWITIQRNNLRAGIIVSVVMLFAVSWEFYEFLSDQFLGTFMQPSNADTMKDLCMGMIGAVIFCVVMLYRADKKNNL